NTYVSVVVFIVLLQISSNFAQGPFQGYVPDLVPAPQVGLASGLMGVMIVLGRIGGVAIGSIGLFPGRFVLAAIGLGLLALATALIAVTTALTTFPAARLSDRLGRKTLVYFTCALGSVGMLGVALAPNIVVAILFVIPVGVAAGAFLAVDWALMTDIVPKATSGRYMGISNVVTGPAGPLAIAIGGIAMDRVGAFDFSL